MVYQESHRRVDLRRVDELVVVKDHGDARPALLDRVDQRGHDQLCRSGRHGLQHLTRLFPRALPGLCNRGREVEQKALRIIVALIE